jgi:Cof subfamily protein (haloacid dehalogenase superfamily)
MREENIDWSQIKLIVTDIDGTLLNSSYELSKDFFPIFHRLSAKGIRFAAASGRQYYNLLNRFESIQSEMSFIAENGSYVVEQGKDLLVQELPDALTKDLLMEARHIPDTYTVLCGKNKAYIENTHPAFVDKVKLYYDRFEVVENLLAVENDRFLKIAICDFAGSEQNSYRYFRDKSDFLQVKISGSIWLDLSHKMANKGRAIRVLQDKYNITPQETMAFGDYLNDLEMMQEVYFSFAVENAHPSIREAARFLTTSNDEDGVIRILQQLLKAIEGK